MTKNKHRKLTLSTETVRALDEKQLSTVAGGRTVTDARCPGDASMTAGGC